MDLGQVAILREQKRFICACVSFLARVGIKCSELSVTLAALPREHLRGCQQLLGL